MGSGARGKGTWLWRKNKKDLSISGHLKEMGFSFLTVSFQHRLEASIPVIRAIGIFKLLWIMQA